MPFQKGNQFAFQKGQTGNPGGRSAKLKELAELCRNAMLDEGGFKLIRRVALTPPGPDDHGNWKWANQTLLEYGFGKPTQPVSGPDEGEERQPLLLKFVEREADADADMDSST